MGEIRTGFVTQTHTGVVTAREAIEWGGELAFDFVELYMDGATERTALAPNAITAQTEALGLDLLVHLPFADLDLGSPRDLIRDGSVAELKACLRTAAEMDAEKAILHASSHATPPEWEPEDVKPRILAAVRELDAFAADRGVEVCVENLPGVIFSIREFDEIIEKTDAALTFDSGHARVDGMDADAMATFLTDHADRVSHVHVNDARVDADEHVPVGSGTTDFDTALAPLREGWTGTVSAEVFTFDFEYLALSKRKLDGYLE